MTTAEGFDLSSLGGIGGGGSADSKLAALSAALKGDGYSYIGATESPSELGVGTDPDQIKNNINAVVDYAQLLINGDGPANRIQKQYGADIPVGDRYFINTGGQCRPVEASVGCQKDGTCKKLDEGTEIQSASGKIKVVPRSMLINNIPENDVPIPSSLKDASAGGSLKFDGIVPGIINDVIGMNPMGMIMGFMIPAFPDCIETSITTVTGKGKDAYKPVTQAAYVITSEAQNINPCAFANFTNPLTGETCPKSEQWAAAPGPGHVHDCPGDLCSPEQAGWYCGGWSIAESSWKCEESSEVPGLYEWVFLGKKEGFSAMNPGPVKTPRRVIMPRDKAVKLYMILVSLLGSYLLYRLLYRKSS